MNFPWLNFQQANPAITGVQTGMDLVKQGMQLPMGPLQVEQAKQQLQLDPLKLLLGVGQLQQSVSRFNNPAYLQKQLLQPLPKSSAAQMVGDNQQQYSAQFRSLLDQAQQQQQADPLTQALVSQATQIANQYGANIPNASWLGGNQQQQQQAQQAQAAQQAQQQQQQQQGQQVQQGQGMQQQPQQKGAQQAAPTSFGVQDSIGFDENSMKNEIGKFLTDTQKEQLVNYIASNQGAAGKETYNRGMASAIFEKYLIDNQDTIGQTLKNASYYAGMKNQLGAKQFDQWLNKNDDRLADYNTYKNSLASILSNSEKFMDKMGATDNQKKELMSVFDNIDKWSENPERIVDEFNKSINYWVQSGRSILSGAQMPNPGIIEKQMGLPSNWNPEFIKNPYKGQQQGAGNQGTGNDPLGIR